MIRKERRLLVNTCWGLMAAVVLNGDTLNATSSPALQAVPSDLAAIIAEAARHYEIDERLLIAVARRESDFRRNAVSPVGARGVMQLMPATAKWLGVRDALDPRQNIFGGARYLKILQKMFDGDLDLMLAAYNAGPATVRRHRGFPSYGETRAYVKSIRNELAAGTAINAR